MKIVNTWREAFALPVILIAAMMITVKNINHKELTRNPLPQLTGEMEHPLLISAELKNKIFSKSITVKDIVNNIPAQWSTSWKGGTRGTKKLLSEILADGEWLGHRCFLIANGPSVRLYDPRALNNFLAGEKSIGINRSYELLPGVTISLASDAHYYNNLSNPRNKNWPEYKKYHAYQGIKCWIDSANRHMDDCYYVRNIGRAGIPTSLKEGVYCHSNTGYSAIQLAIILKANPIYLIGYDLCQDQQGRTHFHDYPTNGNFLNNWRVFSSGLVELHGMLRKYRPALKIINLSLISKVRFWPKMDLDEVAGIKISTEVA